MKADAICTADWHLREDTPPCRTDDYFVAQGNKLSQLAALQREHGDCPILIAGDVFHHWKPSPYLLRWALEWLETFSGPVIAIPGQHDLPQHNLGQYDRSGLAVLEQAGLIHVLKEPTVFTLEGLNFGVTGFPWGVEPSSISPLLDKNIALVHRLVYPGVPPFPGAEASGGTARALLERMPGFDLVVSGDYHKSFRYAGRNRQLLVNPGSLGRQTSDQTDHEPGAYLWFAKAGAAEFHALRVAKDVVTREHLERTEERNERLEAFVRRLGNDYEVGLSFRGNLERFMASNEMDERVKALVWELVEGGK